MTRLILVVALLYSCKLFGQAYEPYKFSSQIIKEIDTTDYKNQEGAWELSFIGDYKNSLFYADRGTKPEGISKKDSLHFLSLEPVPAKDYILDRARKEQIVILNEAHHMPLHRVFASSLLQDLYHAGFKYFGAEAISVKDSTLNDRKFPVIETGYYTLEPQFGNLIRNALSIGFVVFPYEADFSKPIDGKEREIQQAKNIQRILKEDPEAKIFIYAGYDHIREDSLFNSWGKAMAGRLKEYTGIDPFTIDQVEMMEKSSPVYESPYSKLKESEHPVVYVDSIGQPFAGSAGSSKFDVSVFHPKTNYVNGRPDWMFTPDRTPVLVNQRINTSFPCLIVAYKAGEDISQAVPVDVIELKSKKEKKALALKKGRYTILILDVKGEQQTVNVEE